jgi:hypothetical protein
MPQVTPPPVEALNERCDRCGQRIQLTRKEILNKHKATMLKRAAGHVMLTMKNDFKVSDFTKPEEFKPYNHFAQLRLHGLIFKQKTSDGKTVLARWGITKNGWAFLRGEIQIPKYVHVQNNKIKSRADMLVGFNEVWSGEPHVQTSFEYFDDAGNPVGIRPNYGTSQNNQGRLI